tara:strand:+ start:616 stop:927 length:312 start_codon:yes stop_codon:yes gene_type:complete
MANDIQITNAILAINPNAQVTVTNNDYDTIRWTEGTDVISKADVEAKVAELQIEYDAQDYARKRKPEYPSIEELVVALYDTEDKAAIDAKRSEIKLKHPKPDA